MLKVIAAQVRRAVGHAIRALVGVLSLTIVIVRGFAPAAAAIALGFLFRSGLVTLGLLVVASLSVLVVWRLRELRKGRVDHSGPQPSRQQSEAMTPPVVAPVLTPVTDEMVTFHDFDRERNHFRHW